MVEKGQRVVVEGSAPQVVRNAPEPAGSRFLSNVDITLVAPVSVTSEDEEGNGWRRFSSTQNVDRYLRYGSGLYRLTAVAVGSAPGKKPWKCQATFYVKLDGNTAAGLVAGVVAAVGLAGAATASGKSDWAVGDVIPPAETGSDALSTTAEAGNDLAQEVSPDPSGNKRADRTTMGCFGVLIAFMFASDGIELIDSGDDAAAGGALLAGAGGGGTAERRFWRRGHPVRGFLGGLFTGLGLVVFMQQRGYWVLTWANTIAFPLLLAAVAGWRGWRGRAFVVTTRSSAVTDTD